MNLLNLAWRNLWRNRRRTWLTVGAVLFALFITTITRSMQYGTYDLIEAQAIQLFTGEVQIQRAGYQDEQTFAYALEEAEHDWARLVSDMRWVTAHAKRLTGYGLVSGAATSAGAMIVGVEPEAERQVSAFTRNLVAGAPLGRDGGGRALLGAALAQNLAVGLGDTVVVLTQGFRGQMGADVYRVQGLLKTGTLELDRALMVLALPDAQTLFSMPGRFTQLILRTDDFRQAGAYAATLAHTLGDDRLAVLDWNALMPEIQQMILLDNASGAIFLFFILLLVGFEILSTTTMSVMERVREFGVMQAVGMKPGQLSGLVFIELVLQIVLALAVGMAFSGLAVAFFVHNPIPLTAELVEMYEEFGFAIDTLVFSGRPSVFLQPFVAITLIAFLATVYPVLRVRRFTPVEALRHV